MMDGQGALLAEYNPDADDGVATPPPAAGGKNDSAVDEKVGSDSDANSDSGSDSDSSSSD